jgi:hypothetical protein
MGHWCVSGRFFAAASLLAFALAGCTSTSTHPASERLTVLRHGVEVSSAINVDVAYRLPASIRAWPFGGVSDGRYLAFGIEPPAANGRPGDDLKNQPVQQKNVPGRYGIIDETTGELTVRDSLATGANTNYVALVRNPGNTTFLVRVEAIEQPPAACPGIPMTCYAWQITAQQLPDGGAHVIAKGSDSAAATDVPVPVSSGETVAWLDTIRHGMSKVYAWSPGGTALPISAPLPTGILSLTAGNVWIGTPFTLHTLTKIPVDGGPTTTITLPPTATLATVNGDLIAYRQDSSGSSRAVCVTTISLPTRCHRLMQASAIYALTWLTSTTLLVSSPNGYSVVSIDGSISSTTLNHLTLVHSDSRHFVMLVDAGISQLLEVGHLQ